jgi:hypothetical protein
MREFLAIITTLCLGLFVTTVLAYSLEHRQLAYSRVDANANVRPGIVSLSSSGYAIKVLEKPVSTPVDAGDTANEI